MNKSDHLIIKRSAVSGRFGIWSIGGNNMRATRTMTNRFSSWYFVNHRRANPFTRAILFFKNRGNKSRSSVETVHLAQIAGDTWSMRDIGHTIRNL